MNTNPYVVSQLASGKEIGRHDSVLCIDTGAFRTPIDGDVLVFVSRTALQDHYKEVVEDNTNYLTSKGFFKDELLDDLKGFLIASRGFSDGSISAPHLTQLRELLYQKYPFLK